MAVASFCDRPFQLPLQQETRAEKDKRRPLLEDLQRDPRLRLSFGLHPECVSPLIFRVTEESERLKKLLSLPNTVAFGEVGLDYTEPEADWQEQRLFLEQLLGLMKGSLDRIPVMVHCRSARDDLCGILETYLAWEQEIQLHYFNGEPKDVVFWLNAFPNGHFSVSGIVGRFNQEQKEALAPHSSGEAPTGDKLAVLSTVGLRSINREEAIQHTIHHRPGGDGRREDPEENEARGPEDHNAKCPSFLQASGGALVSGRMERVAGEQKQPVGSRLEYVSTA